MDDKMSVAQISRMSHWLQSHGHTPEEILDCIDYISKAKNEEEPSKEKSQNLPQLPTPKILT